MRNRACTAASELPDFENASGDCTGNPAVTWELIKPPAVTDCGGLTGLVDPCIVHVTVTYDFRPFVSIPPIPSQITFIRESLVRHLGPACQLMKRLRRRSRGQAMVEFALVAPMFFLLLFAIIEFGRAVYYIQMLNNAAREGARFAIVHGSESPLPERPASRGRGQSVRSERGECR